MVKSTSPNHQSGALARLIDAADEALYEIKAEGRNGWRLAPMMGGPATSDAA
ncbi:MAG: hypothetical protein ACYC10_21805 [Allorhizobium sp.]